MIWRIAWTSHARRNMRNLDKSTRERLRAAIRLLAETNRGDLVKLRDGSGEWRLRVGDWRAILRFDNPNGEMHILRVQHRRESYR